MKLFSAPLVKDARDTSKHDMFRAIGVIMVLWYLSHLFGNSFQSLDKALTATFETLEATLVASREGIH